MANNIFDLLGLSAAPQSEEEKLIEEAKNAPVRPEYQKILEMEQTKNPAVPERGSFLGAGAPSAEDRTINTLNDMDLMKSNPEKLSNSRLQELKNISAMLSGADNNTRQPASVPSAPFGPQNLIGPKINSESEVEALTSNISSHVSPSRPKQGTKSSEAKLNTPTESTKAAVASANKMVEDLYGKDLNDAALKEAQEQANLFRLIGGLANASSTIGAGISRGAVEAKEVGKDIIANADTGVKDIQARREGKDKELSRRKTLAEMSDTDAMRDPNSPISKSIRQGMTEMFPKIKLPDNVSAKSLHDMGINYSTLIASKERADAQREAARERALTRELAANSKREEKEKLSDKQVTLINNYDKALGSIDRILDDKERFDTGPVSALQNKVAGWVGLDDSKKTAFKAEVQDQLAMYIKDISGTGVSNKERAFLMENLPKLSDNDATFMAKAKMIKERVERNKNIELQGFRKQGKNISNFADESSSQVKTTSDGDDPRIDAFMKANNIKDRKEAIRILKENGKL